MDPATKNMACKMSLSSTPFIVDRPNPNLASSNFYRSSSVNTPVANSNNHYSYPDIAPPTMSSLNYTDLL
ncbi:unnamed protein product, partial [Rotaria magnacalcarata]